MKVVPGCSRFFWLFQNFAKIMLINFCENSIFLDSLHSFQDSKFFNISRFFWTLEKRIFARKFVSHFSSKFKILKTVPDWSRFVLYFSKVSGFYHVYVLREKECMTCVMLVRNPLYFFENLNFENYFRFFYILFRNLEI